MFHFHSVKSHLCTSLFQILGKAMVSSEVDASQQIASQQMMARTQFSKQADFASTTAALSTGLTRRQTTSVSKMASSETKSVSSMSSQQVQFLLLIC